MDWLIEADETTKTICVPLTLAMLLAVVIVLCVCLGIDALIRRLNLQGGLHGFDLL